MVKSKKYKIALASLITASAVSLSAAAMVMAGNTPTTFAARAPVALDGSTIFYTALRGAEITYSPEETVNDGETTSKHSYAMFSLESDETVDMRNNLAYSWIKNKKDEGKFTSDGEGDKFSMEIGFPDAQFSKYVLKFQSQQFTYTEDKVSENYLVFTPVAEGTELQLSITDSLKDADDEALTVNYAVGSHVKIEFGNFDNGDYEIYVNGINSGKKFKNVNEYYAMYNSSTTAGVTPISFSAEFPEGAPAGAKANMALYSLNGQSFELKTQVKENDQPKLDENGNVVYEVKVVDDTSPVVCFKKTPSYVEYGKTLSLEYEVIDVLTKTPRSTAYFYVLSGEQYGDDAYDYDKTEYDSSEQNPFTESKSEIRVIRDSKTFVPTLDGEIAEDIYGLVKVYIKVYDDYSSDSPTDYVYAHWYAKSESLVDIYELKNAISGVAGEPEKHSYFLQLIDEKPGVTFADAAYTELDDYSGVDVLEKYKETVAAVQIAYQTAINEAIEALKDEDGNVLGKLYAGSDSKFYLPSMQPAFKQVYSGDGMTLADDYLNITDYKYILYYKGNSTGSTSELDYNKLAIDIKDANTSYRFTVYITDAFGNPMRYPSGVENGEIVWKEIKKDDVWDADYDELLPRFSFSVYYKEATAKNPENLPLAYVGTTYNGISFDIKGVSNTYTANYKLYVFNRNKMYEEDANHATLNYDEFNSRFNELFNDKATRKYFTTVKPASELLETDDNYEEFKLLNWNKSNVTFVPQSVEVFYVVELNLEDNQTKASKQYYTTVASSIATNPLQGESDWVENNVVSIVLLSVAGVCLIGLILLFILKPKDKGDIDAVYLEEEEKKAAKKEKKSAKKKS